MFNMPSVQEKYWQNLEYAENPKFVRWMVNCLRRNLVQVLRVHVSGDYHSVAYIEKWQEIMRRSPRVTFYSYTRSWIVRKLQPGLKQLALSDNHQLWLSTDRSMPAPPKWAGTKICYLSENDKDLPKSKVDLVFRNEDETVMKKTPRGVQICPVEVGIHYEPPITCSTCQLCWRDKLVQIGGSLAHAPFRTTK